MSEVNERGELDERNEIEELNEQEHTGAKYQKRTRRGVKSKIVDGERVEQRERERESGQIDQIAQRRERHRRNRLCVCVYIIGFDSLYFMFKPYTS